MFFIVNKTKSEIFIKDIRMKLGPRQALDLDKLMGREKSDNSKDLTEKVRKGIIKIVTKDEIDKFKFKQPSKGKNDIALMKEELIKEMKTQFKEIGKDLRKQVKESGRGISVDEIKEAMKELIVSMPQASNTIIMREVKESLAKETGIEIDELDEELLVDIHARAVNELTKESKLGYVDYKEEKVIETLDDKVNELESLGL